MSDPRPSSQGAGPEVKGEQEASQGRKGWGVRRILAVSLVLVIAAFFVIYLVHAPGLSTNHGAGGQAGIVNHAEANSFHAPEPAPKPAPANGSATSSSNQPTPH